MLQFPYPIPDEPPVSSGERLVACILIVWMLVTLLSLLLPRPWFVSLFKVAFPFMPDKLEDLDRK